MLKGTKSQRKKTNCLADIELSAMRANIELLNSILENSQGATNYETMKNYHETVKRISEYKKRNHSGARSFQISFFIIGCYSAKMF